MILFYLSIPLIVLLTIGYSVVSMIGLLIDRSGGTYLRQMRQWSRAMLWLLRVRVVSHGVDHIDYREKHVYVANHSSYLDIIAISAALPDELRFVFKEELGSIPVFGWSLRNGPNVLINRADAREAMASIDHAAGQIRQGRGSVVIFPEGTRSADGSLGEFKRGGFLLATRAGVPIVPVAIRGSFRLMPRDAWRVRPGTIEVLVGSPIDVPDQASRADERRILDQTHEIIATMLLHGSAGIRPDRTRITA